MPASSKGQDCGLRHKRLIEATAYGTRTIIGAPPRVNVLELNLDLDLHERQAHQQP